MMSVYCKPIFLPTPSARRATRISDCCNSIPHRISTHALREEGDHRDGGTGNIVAISTHALREEGDSAPTAGR